jgi:hypothetical protein
MTKDEVLNRLDGATAAMKAAADGRLRPVLLADIYIPALQEVHAAVAALYEAQAWRKTADERPKDGQLIAYYFEPFGTISVGRYEEKYDTVAGRAGFTTMTPEVPLWFALPPIPETDSGRG